MEKYILFLTFYFFAFQLPTNSFHLDGGKKIDEKNLNDREFLTNETFISVANRTHNLIETSTTSTGLKIPKNEPLSIIKSNAVIPSINNGEMKVYGKPKPWRATKYAVPEKSLNLRSIASHPKRESSSHATWHKNSKDHRLKFGSANNAKENGFNGFEMIVVDVPSSYSRMQWDKPRVNTFTSPSFHYLPVNAVPSVFDLLFGLNSISENLFKGPADVENEIYFQQSMENPYWNRRASFNTLLNPAGIHKKAISGDTVQKDMTATHMCGKLSEPIKNFTCTCEERNSLP